MKKLLAIALLSSAIAAPAFAQESPFYVGALAGDKFFGVLGGYQIDQTFAAELHYTNIYTPDVNGFGMWTSTDSYNTGISLVATLPWRISKVPELSFFVKGGVERTSVKTTIGYNLWGTPYTASASVSSTDLALGGGAQYQLNKNFSARAGFGVAGQHTDLYVAGILRF